MKNGKWFLIFTILFAAFPAVTKANDKTDKKTNIGVTGLTTGPDFDFSRCGYDQNQSSIPLVPAVFIVEPIAGDATALIQRAIDEVSARTPDAKGFRGAVLLAKGEFKISGQILISTSGVVLRGSGKQETTLIASGNSRRSLIKLEGQPAQLGEVYKVEGSVAAGATKLNLNTVAGLSVGDTVFIDRPSSQEWIKALGMDSFEIKHKSFLRFMLNWQAGSRNIRWDRTITKIAGKTVSLDVPITTAIDVKVDGSASLRSYIWPDRLIQCGVENLSCISDYDKTNPKDEEHAWICVQFSKAKDSWVRNVRAQYFVSSTVRFDKTVSQSTVKFCSSLDPVSEIGGRRRVTFYNGGQLNLFRNCRSDNGRHDFVVGFCSAGPNVFKDCRATKALSFSGSFESWACGALFDNVTIEGNAIRFANLEKYCDGMGWSASQSTLWNCRAKKLDVENPPGSKNHSFGGNGNGVEPKSLFASQLKVRRLNTLVAKAFEFTSEKAPLFVFKPQKKKSVRPLKEIKIINGRFVIQGNIFWSGHVNSVIWRDRMPRVKEDNGGRPCVVRWTPGYEGSGYTDDLHTMTKELLKLNQKLFSFCPPLWYDRRRMAHDIDARTDGDVVGPFLELPWSRSGQGIAHDGLSKYDLEKFNPWYFSRVKEFAACCDQEGVLLYNEFYNNHWLIEAAAHWPDFAWRPKNSLQNTGMTEPVPYINKTRIAIAHEFYDVSAKRPENRRLHKLYIEHCLDNLKGKTNVLHTLAFQDTAPLEFAQFFLDILRDWQQKNGLKLKVALKTAKNVTDALLANSKYAELISVIDMRRWRYLTDGSLYAPEGGKSKAYREYKNEKFGRNKEIPHSTPQLLYKQVRLYRDAYPNKAIIANIQGVGALPILMAGGAYSLYENEGASKPDKNEKALQEFIRTDLAEILWKMLPDDNVTKSKSNWCLAAKGSSYLIYSQSGKKIQASIPKGHYTQTWYTPTGVALGKVKSFESNGSKLTFTPPQGSQSLILIKKVK